MKRYQMRWAQKYWGKEGTYNPMCGKQNEKGKEKDDD